ncbi:unnamed protein product [Phytophthora lilii]|uniref:Unnamed protein product n=1 Tax=Phytophthora lilii TaxID=2077276 RepID=A0A9W6WQL0_9STRA|nr:unnamed protein product [Phytophthora lilii]
MTESISYETTDTVHKDIDEQSVPRDSLLDDFHESQQAQHRTNSGSIPKTFATPGFLECDCVAATKRGRYNEAVCGAHKLTLRNSRPHLESIEFSQKIASLAEQNSLLAKSITKLSSSRQLPANSSAEELDSVLLRASKSTSSLRQQHNFTSEPSISLLPSLYSNLSSRPRSEGGFLEAPRGRNDFSLSSLTLDATTTLSLQEAQQMLELYNKIIQVNTETQKNMAIMYTRRSTLLAAMGKYSAALQDAEQVVLLDSKSTVVSTQMLADVDECALTDLSCVNAGILSQRVCTVWPWPLCGS